MNATPSNPTATAVNRIHVIGFALASGVLMALAAAWLDHTPGGVFGHIQEIAAWLQGGPKPEVVTWPAWGYAGLITAIRSLPVVVWLQAGVGLTALTALAARLWQLFPAHRRLTTGLLLLAAPWHAVQVELYASALAGSLTLLALLALEKTLRTGDGRGALVAGVLAGLAQNFRTEFMLLPLFIAGCAAGLRACGLLSFPSLKPFGRFIAMALALQLPWAVFYHQQSGRFALTESNLGHVLYVSLGSDPHNPWGIKGDDGSATESIRGAGHTFSSLSDAGSQFLLRQVAENIAAHPSSLIPRTLQQLKNTLVAPFSWGVPALSEADKLDLDVLREELKSRLNVGVNVRELEEYRARGLYPTARKNLSAIAALLYQFATVGAGSLVLLLGLAGMGLVLFQVSAVPIPPLLLLLGCTAGYKVAQNVLLCYQVNYLNNVYPLFVPFAVVSLVTLGGLMRRGRSKARPALA